MIENCAYNIQPGAYALTYTQRHLIRQQRKLLTRYVKNFWQGINELHNKFSLDPYKSLYVSTVILVSYV